VINYWDDDVPVKLSEPGVKWLLLERKSDKTLFLVLQSYQKQGTPVDIKLDAARFGFIPSPKARDMEAGVEVKVEATAKELNIKVSLPAPFGTKVLIIGAGS
jgi:hypothetical protein